jgi:phage terminase large subunit
MFKGSNSPDNPDQVYERLGEFKKNQTNRQTFKNKRAQYYWELRDRIYRTWEAVTKGRYHDPDTLISFSSEIEAMPLVRAEVCRIPRKPNRTGLLQVMGKEDMRGLGLESPNMSDSIMMSLAADLDLEEEIEPDYHAHEFIDSGNGWMM